MAKTYGPYSTLHSKKDHYIDIKLYTPFTIYVVSDYLNPIPHGLWKIRYHTGGVQCARTNI